MVHLRLRVHTRLVKKKVVYKNNNNNSNSLMQKIEMMHF